MGMTAFKEEKLHTRVDQIDDLWEEVHKVRSNSKTVRVDKDALTALLLDHRTMAEELLQSPIIGRPAPEPDPFDEGGEFG